MNKDAYKQWQEEELKATDEAYLRYQKSGLRSSVSGHHSPITIIIAAAVLILSIGTGVWMKRDSIFGLSEQQVSQSYKQTVKALSLYSESLNNSFDRLKTLRLNDDNSAPR